MSLLYSVLNLLEVNAFSEYLHIGVIHNRSLVKDCGFFFAYFYIIFIALNKLIKKLNRESMSEDHSKVPEQSTAEAGM